MDDTYAISLAKTEYRDGINAGDLDKAMTAIAPALILMTDGEPSFWGKEGRDVLRWRWQRLIEENEVKFEVILGILKIFGEYAFAWGWEILDLKPKSGAQSCSVRNRYFEIWQKDEKGIWKISSLMNNKDLPAAMPPNEVLAQ